MKPPGKMRDYIKAAVQSRGQDRKTSCLDDGQVLAFYSRQLGEDQMDRIRDHITECPKCLDLALEARQFLQAMGEPAQPIASTAQATSSSWFRAHRNELFLLAASVIIVVSLVLILSRGSRVEMPQQQVTGISPPSSTTPALRENPWRDLQIAKADYTPAPPSAHDLIFRDEGAKTQDPPKLSPFARAMRPYEQNAFDEAERRLAQLLEKNPRQANAHFYRGVSLLLLGKPGDAIAPFQAAIEHGQGRVDEEAHWYLARAYLKVGEPSKALEQLDEVIRNSNRRRVEAEQLRQQIKQALEKSETGPINQ